MDKKGSEESYSLFSSAQESCRSNGGHHNYNDFHNQIEKYDIDVLEESSDQFELQQLNNSDSFSEELEDQISDLNN